MACVTATIQSYKVLVHTITVLVVDVYSLLSLVLFVVG